MLTKHQQKLLAMLRSKPDHDGTGIGCVWYPEPERYFIVFDHITTPIRQSTYMALKPYLNGWRTAGVASFAYHSTGGENA